MSASLLLACSSTDSTVPLAAHATGGSGVGGAAEPDDANGGDAASSAGGNGAASAASPAGGANSAGTAGSAPSESAGGGAGASDRSGGAGPVASGGEPAATGTGGAESTGLTGDAAEFVDAHNEVRAAVTEPSDYPGTWAPLPLVTWSDEVAATAQVWADHLRDELDCGLEHDSNMDYGENIAAGRGLSPTAAVQMWASEGADYTFDPDYEFDMSLGHYTQIVWRESTEIGCASASCSGGSTVIVCRYSPPGNRLGQAPY